MTPRPFVRSRSLEALREEEFDLVVIGGGVTGAGVVLDAASRGLRAALIERDDFASGTSSKSSKLVHGGLRYLQQGEVGLVYEALAERQRLLKNAPHLVKVLPFLIPMFGKDGIIPSKIARLLGAAMWGYDLTGGLRIGKRHKRLDKAETLKYMPTLPESRLVSSYLYFDAAADDARLVVTLLRTASLDHGAVVANRVAAKGLKKDAGGRISAVEAEADGETFLIRTRSVVNAAGVWSDDVRAQDEGTHPHSIRPAKGIHISVPWKLVRNEIAAVIPVPKDKRSVFVVPQGDLTYIGTTDTDYTGPLDDPQCTPEDIAYLLKAINGSCTNQIHTTDIVGSWAGLRPLVKAASTGRTADLSRKHKVSRSRSGLVTITGGKLTTYREMAADTVDEIVKTVLPNHDSPKVGRSVTKSLRLRGAAGFDTLGSARSVYPAVSAELLEHLGSRYGGEARVVMAAIQKDPSLAEPLVADLPYVKAEAVFAVRHEMAGSVDDVLARRTRARIFGRDDSAGAADTVAEIIGEELGWTQEQRLASVAEYRKSVEHERASAELPVTHLAELIES
ncbi:MAG: glycerol-3-phosphate dehydrogenase/oxidase [Microthrixaceae bacterium]